MGSVKRVRFKLDEKCAEKTETSKENKPKSHNGKTTSKNCSNEPREETTYIIWFKGDQNLTDQAATGMLTLYNSLFTVDQIFISKRQFFTMNV